MRQDKAPRVVERRPGGSYNLVEFFALLRVSYSKGCELINQYPDEIPVFYLGPSSPRVSDETVGRLQREGLPGVTGFRRRIPRKTISGNNAA